MDRCVGLFVEIECAQPSHDHILQIRLPRIDDIEDLGRAPKMRCVTLRRLVRRDPDLLAIRVRRPGTVEEVLSEQPELPKLIGDVLSHISNRSIRTDYHLAIAVTIIGY